MPGLVISIAKHLIIYRREGGLDEIEGHSVAQKEPWDGCSVWMGVDTTDDDWWLRIAGTHTLVAGSSVSGKASLVWGVTIGLGPAIARGEAQVHGIDLKGGVELGMGKSLSSGGPESFVP